MYKLKYLKAVNFIGFRSGLGKKTFEIDLSNMIDKSLIVILGDNGMGKTTLASIIPPTHTPFGIDKSFIMAGKEGLLIREYVNDYGEIIQTKCVYSPKKDDGHTSKAFIGIIKGKEYVELNPNGNIDSYYFTVENYFKISRHNLSLTYYDDNIKSLIKMTRQERVNSINKYITNNIRFNNAYDVINEKFKAARNVMKNTIQKLNTLRDEKKLSQLLETIETYINNKSSKYEDIIKKISILENEMDKLLKGTDVDEVSDKLNKCAEKIKVLRLVIKSLRNVNFEIKAEDRLVAIEKDIFELQFSINNSPLNKLKDELYSLEESLERYETINTFSDVDIDELEKLLVKIDNDIAGLTYTKNPSLYSKMSMTEIELLDNKMVDIQDLFDVLYQSFSNYLIEYYKDKKSFPTAEKIRREMKVAEERLVKTELAINEIQIKLSYFSNFSEMKNRLAMRPKSCNNNDCVFIADALKWMEYESEIEKLNSDLESLTVYKEKLNEEISDLADVLDFLNQVVTLDNYIKDVSVLLPRYVNIDVSDLTKAMSKGYLPDAFNYKKVRDFMLILSEKELYEELTTISRPSIVNKIEIYRSKEDNINLILNEIKLINKKIDKISNELKDESEKVKVFKDTLKVLEDEKEQLLEIISDNKRHNEIMAELSELINEFESYDGIIRELSSIRVDLKELKEERNFINDELSRMFKERDGIKFELIQVKNYKYELSSIENEFVIYEIIKMMTQPGKAITKDTIDIFMDEIHETASMLISKTFGGKLVLLPFDIDDDRFNMPYSFNGILGEDLSDASSAQRNIASNCISMSLLSKIIDNYGITLFDEPDSKLSPDNRQEMIDIIAVFGSVIGFIQSFIITHSPEYYEGYDVGYILFPGYKLSKLKETDYVMV